MPNIAFWVIVAFAVCVAVTGILWCCLHHGKEEPAEIRVSVREPREPVHEAMDLRMPEKESRPR